MTESFFEQNGMVSWRNNLWRVDHVSRMYGELKNRKKGEPLSWRFGIRDVSKPKPGDEKFVRVEEALDIWDSISSKIEEEIQFFERKAEETALDIKRLSKLLDEGPLSPEDIELLQSLSEHQPLYELQSKALKADLSSFEEEFFDTAKEGKPPKARVNLSNVRYGLFHFANSPVSEETMEKIMKTGLLSTLRKGNFLNSTVLTAACYAKAERGEYDTNFGLEPDTVLCYSSGDAGLTQIVELLKEYVLNIKNGKSNSFLINYPKNNHFTSITIKKDKTGKMTILFSDPIDGYASDLIKKIKEEFRSIYGDNVQIVEVEGVKNKDFGVGSNTCYFASVMNSLIASEILLEEIQGRSQADIQGIFSGRQRETVQALQTRSEQPAAARVSPVPPVPPVPSVSSNQEAAPKQNLSESKAATKAKSDQNPPEKPKSRLKKKRVPMRKRAGNKEGKDVENAPSDDVFLNSLKELCKKKVERNEERLNEITKGIEESIKEFNKLGLIGNGENAIFTEEDIKLSLEAELDSIIDKEKREHVR